jgi:3-oxoacyl-[acyl-carrier protein] reductase
MGVCEGQLAIVTGASRGIGEAIAHALALAGARVVATGRDTHRLAAVCRSIEESGGQAVAHVLDLANQAGIARFVADVESTWVESTS